MVINLERYNEFRTLLIETDATGSWRHVHYWDGGWEVSVTMVAVHMGRKGTEERT